MPGPNKKPRPKKQHDVRGASFVRIADECEREAENVAAGNGLTSAVEIANAGAAIALRKFGAIARAEGKRARRLR